MTYLDDLNLGFGSSLLARGGSLSISRVNGCQQKGESECEDVPF